MMRQLTMAWVIARRDYTATVFSRAFLLFLLGPLLMFGFAGVFGAVGGRSDDIALRPVIAVIGDANTIKPIEEAYNALDARLSDHSLPGLRVVPPHGDSVSQAKALLSAQQQTASLVMTGWPAHPRLTGPGRQIGNLEPDVQLILGEVATRAALGRADIRIAPTTLDRTVIDPAGGSSSASRHVVARGAQFVLFFLIMLLSGMLLSNMVEEKSNKVIEVLAAAVPIDAIFFGKLVAMLAVSLTGILVWGSLLAAAVLTLLPEGMPLPVPAMGWPLFVVLGAVYFMMNYMLLGGVFIGIGSQANSPREVQTMSMPVTMSQLAVFALASATVNDPAAPLASFAQIFPLSSPLAMLGRAAQEPVIWPHLLALAWQAMWVAIIVRFAARRFRVGVLKSGGPKRAFWRRRATS